MADPIVAVVPAAGAGTRLGASVPKQYLTLLGTPIVQRSLDAMLGLSRVLHGVVVLGEESDAFDRLPAAADARITRISGGTTRARSVAAGVAAVRAAHGDDAWALVHDAARPLVASVDVNRLIDAVLDANSGGILAAPVTDTIKRASASMHVLETLARDTLWCAQTPQMFRAGLLGDALLDAFAANAEDSITDEASAMERVGHACLLIKASRANPKITHADDLPVAEALLSAHGDGGVDADR